MNTPRVLPSDKSISEINAESQARLMARRKENEHKEKYLFGYGKKVVEISESPVKVQYDNIPHHKHKYHHNLYIK